MNFFSTIEHKNYPISGWAALHESGKLLGDKEQDLEHGVLVCESDPGLQRFGASSFQEHLHSGLLRCTQAVSDDYK